ncbi:MAG: cobalt-precorrin 5A hydrolase [Candidatus Methanoplasma sp.]|jgi:cobalt-precorrin 5A hydrolase|nr:cobalt-precorrin 5A hydrolase [Candidatus Methanoplasma sp.]
MKIGIICFSARGCELAKRIAGALEGDECELFSKTSAPTPGVEALGIKAGEWVAGAFRRYRGIVFVGAAGIAVRYIAPCVASKTSDPAVVCVDERGRHSIALLSGHIGGGNGLASRIAEGIGAEPVITTATDIGGLFSVDSYAAERGMHIGSMRLAKEVSSRIVDGGKVGFKSDVPVRGSPPPELEPSDSGSLGVYISYGRSEGPFGETLKLTPRCHVLGIGCRRGAPREAIEELAGRALESAGASMDSVRLVASIDVKSDEAGLLEFCSAHGLEARFFSAGELRSVPGGFSSSERVRRAVGVDNVCERAAVAASDGGEIVVKKITAGGVAAALAREPASADFGDPDG